MYIIFCCCPFYADLWRTHEKFCMYYRLFYYVNVFLVEQRPVIPELGGRWWCPPLLFSRRNESLKLIVSLIIKIIIELLQGDSHQGRDNNSLYLGHKKEIFLILDFSGIWFTILNVVYLSDCLHLPFVVDIISAIEFDKTGDHLATGDRGGRVVLFERTDTKEVCFYFWGILIIIILLEAELRTDYSLGFSLLQTVSVACWKSKRFRENRLSG